MAKFSDTLKKFGQGTGQWLTLEGRNLAQLYKNLELASKVKRVKPEDYSSSTEYKAALKKSQEANKKLQSELINPSANAALNRILNISPEQQSRQSASQLYGMTKERPQGTTFSPELLKTTANLASKLPIPGLNLIGSIAVGGAQAGSAGLGMSDPGKEVESALTAVPFGMAGGAMAYGLSKLGQALLNKTRVIPPKTAGKKATLDWGFKAKDIEKVGGWEEAQKVATDLYSDAQELGLKTTNRYDKANALATIKDVLNNTDLPKMIEAFDQAGTPAANANSVINAIKNDNRLSLALSKDPGTAEWLYNTISSFADDSGNLSMASVKELMSTLVDTAGGLKGTTGDQSNLQRQILTAGRGALRDTVSKVSAPISNAMTRLFNYIQISPSVTGQVVKQAKLPIPAVKVGTGTFGTEVSDAIGGLLNFSGKGGQGSVTTPYKGIGNVLETIGLVGQQIPKGIIGSTVGTVSGNMTSGALPQMEQQLGDDDEGIQMIRSAFGQSGSMQPKGLRMAGLPEQTSMEQSTSGVSNQESQALKQMLAISILNGQISGAEANAVLSLLGMDSKEEEGGGDKQQAINAVNQMEGLYGVGTGNSLSIGKNVGIGGLLQKGGRSVTKQFDQEFVDRMTAYDQQKSIAAGIINKVVRMAGTLNEGEYQTLLANMPNEYSTEEQAQSWFNNIRDLIRSSGSSTNSFSQEDELLNVLGLQ